MRWRRLALLLLLAAAGPIAAQEEGDDDIIVDGDPGPPPEPEPEPEPERPPDDGRRPPDHPPPPSQEKEPFDPEIAPTAENINRAIERGVEWLRAAQREDGSWGPCHSGGIYGQEGSAGRDCYESGPTSFAIFTLAKCDVSPRDRGIRKGLKWLHGMARKDIQLASYESASIILMLTALYAPTQARRPSDNPSRKALGTKFREDDWEWMHERIQQLCVGWKPPWGGSARELCQQNRGGGWRYWDASGDQDASATQFVLLALREAVRAGYPLNDVDPTVWQDAAEAARSFQAGNGAFRYRHDYPWSAGMTAASIASLMICKEQMLLAGQPVPSWLDDSVHAGIERLGEIFDVTQNTVEEEHSNRYTHYHYYHLYALERAGVLANKREFGSKAWYPRGAAFLLAQQKDDGRWVDPTCMIPKDVLGTCFALLFLKRATPPPAITVTGD